MIAKLQAKHRRIAEKIFLDVDTGEFQKSKPGFIGVNLEDKDGTPPDIDWLVVPREEG